MLHTDLRTAGGGTSLVVGADLFSPRAVPPVVQDDSCDGDGGVGMRRYGYINKNIMIICLQLTHSSYSIGSGP